MSSPADPQTATAAKRLPFDGKALVSVVIPTFNRLSFLQRAIRSALNQSYSNLEILVVDGGSRDGSLDWLGRVEDPRLRVIRLDHSTGAGHNRQIGAKSSRGDYIGFLDSDDFWLKEKVTAQLRIFERHPGKRIAVVSPPFSFDGINYFRPLYKPRVKGVSIIDHVYAAGGATILSSGIMVCGTVGRELCFDPALHVNQDTDYVFRLESEGVRIICLQQPVWVHDVTPRADRISHDPRRAELSMQWFERVSPKWSNSARRGYLFMDASIRFSRSGRKGRALGLWLKNIQATPSVWYAVRQLVRIFSGGEVRSGLRKLWRRLNRSKDWAPQKFRKLAQLGEPET